MCEGNTILAVALKQLLLLVCNVLEQMVIGIGYIDYLWVNKLEKHLLNFYSCNFVIIETTEIVKSKVHFITWKYLLL